MSMIPPVPSYGISCPIAKGILGLRASCVIVFSSFFGLWNRRSLCVCPLLSLCGLWCAGRIVDGEQPPRSRAKYPCSKPILQPSGDRGETPGVLHLTFRAHRKGRALTRCNRRHKENRRIVFLRVEPSLGTSLLQNKPTILA